MTICFRHLFFLSEDGGLTGIVSEEQTETALTVGTGRLDLPKASVVDVDAGSTSFVQLLVGLDLLLVSELAGVPLGRDQAQHPGQLTARHHEARLSAPRD